MCLRGVDFLLRHGQEPVGCDGAMRPTMRPKCRGATSEEQKAKEIKHVGPAVGGVDGWPLKGARPCGNVRRATRCSGGVKVG